MGAGITKSNQFAVQGPLLADQYPIEARGRVFAGTQLAGTTAGTLSPVLVGAIAALAGGSAGWRWAFLLLAIPAGVAALAAYRLREPPRGQYEKQDVLGIVVEEDEPARISTEAAFSRLLQINTLPGQMNISTNIAAVPLPGALWLFGSAVLGFLGFTSRRKLTS